MPSIASSKVTTTTIFSQRKARPWKRDFLRLATVMSNSSQISCDYRFVSIIVTNQSTNIEDYRLIDYVFDDRFFRSLNDPHEKRCVTQGLGMARHKLVALVVKDTVLKLKVSLWHYTTNVCDLLIAVTTIKKHIRMV